jgi:hypothetical protein
VSPPLLSIYPAAPWIHRASAPRRRQSGRPPTETATRPAACHPIKSMVSLRLPNSIPSVLVWQPSRAAGRFRPGRPPRTPRRAVLVLWPPIWSSMRFS